MGDLRQVARRSLPLELRCPSRPSQGRWGSGKRTLVLSRCREVAQLSTGSVGFRAQLVRLFRHDQHGRGDLCAASCATLPSSIVARSDRPRVPTTISPASWLMATSISATPTPEISRPGAPRRWRRRRPPAGDQAASRPCPDASRPCPAAAAGDGPAGRRQARRPRMRLSCTPPSRRGALAACRAGARARLAYGYAPWRGSRSAHSAAGDGRRLAGSRSAIRHRAPADDPPARLRSAGPHAPAARSPTCWIPHPLTYQLLSHDVAADPAACGAGLRPQVCLGFRFA